MPDLLLAMTVVRRNARNRVEAAVTATDGDVASQLPSCQQVVHGMDTQCNTIQCRIKRYPELFDDGPVASVTNRYVLPFMGRKTTTQVPFEMCWSQFNAIMSACFGSLRGVDAHRVESGDGADAVTKMCVNGRVRFGCLILGLEGQGHTEQLALFLPIFQRSNDAQVQQSETSECFYQ